MLFRFGIVCTKSMNIKTFIYQIPDDEKTPLVL